MSRAITNVDVYAWPIMVAYSDTNVSDLVKIPKGTVGTIISEYYNNWGILIVVLEFDDGLWTRINERLCTYL